MVDRNEACVLRGQGEFQLEPDFEARQRRPQRVLQTFFLPQSIFFFRKQSPISQFVPVSSLNVEKIIIKLIVSSKEARGMVFLERIPKTKMPNPFLMEILRWRKQKLYNFYFWNMALRAFTSVNVLCFGARNSLFQHSEWFKNFSLGTRRVKNRMMMTHSMKRTMTTMMAYLIIFKSFTMIESIKV